MNLRVSRACVADACACVADVCGCRWSRAHPYRYICHNGEINTLRGNKNWQRAREGTISSPDLPELKECCPIIEPEGSDSQTFDNVLELLIMGGRTLPEAILMMMPEAWQNNDLMPAEKRRPPPHARARPHACVSTFIFRCEG